jgi:hypothetical protein
MKTFQFEFANTSKFRLDAHDRKSAIAKAVNLTKGIKTYAQQLAAMSYCILVPKKKNK